MHRAGLSLEIALYPAAHVLLLFFAGAVLVRMSESKIFKLMGYLARDTAKSAQLNIDDDAAQHLHARVAKLAAGISATDEADFASYRTRSAYYSVIARAVSRLPSNTREARQALYDRAGIALAAQLLQERELPLSDEQVAIERLAFERAIRTVEREARKKEPPTSHDQIPQEHRRGPFSSFLSFFRSFRH
jgi:hypothetical protein